MGQQARVALITGAARRVGAAIAEYLHAQGMNVVIHHHSSETAAKNLAATLNSIRQNSAIILKENLNFVEGLPALAANAYHEWGRLDVLVNNAARFFATPFAQFDLAGYEELFQSNLRAPLFLSQACAPYLRQTQGCIIHITDTHADKPLKNHLLYGTAKAGLNYLTKAMAQELGPEIRVNAVAPGAVCWPEQQNSLNEEMKTEIVTKTPLKRAGNPQEVAKAVWFLINEASFTTGQILKVDGGRNI